MLVVVSVELSVELLVMLVVVSVELSVELLVMLVVVSVELSVELQLVAPLDEYLPATHTVQLLAPVVDEYLPATHTVQLLAPVDDEYVPTSQRGHPYPCIVPVLEAEPIAHGMHPPPWFHDTYLPVPQ
jgi:hypothetical protein